MPSKYVTKEQIPDSYYHVYARGINKQKIFSDNTDFNYFLKLFERYLSQKPTVSKTGVEYPNYEKDIKILAYCLMNNHFHILIHQINTPYLEKIMRSIMTSYSRYFNLKYKRTGPLFESCYKAIRITDDIYLQHVSRYIHLNPKSWQNYKNSSFKYYLKGNEPFWMETETILSRFRSRECYCNFVSDYEELRDEININKYKLDKG